MYISFPDYVHRMIERLMNEGYDSYAVGGCIRDTILGREPHDWDITTAARPSDVIRVFSDGELRAVEGAGIRHGTVTVLANGAACEITTFRSDGAYADHRRPASVSFSDTVEEDLGRRDFTMNAIAARPQGGEVLLIDPFGGERDIEARVIRAVGDPGKRLSEDALRILRAVRFTAELGFAPDAELRTAAAELCETLGYVSKERITEELLKCLSARFLPMATDSFPEIFDRFCGASARRFCLYCSETENPLVRLALMSKHGTDGDELFRQLTLPKKTKGTVRLLLGLDRPPRSDSDVCALMRAFGNALPALAEYLHILQLDGTFGGAFYEGEALLDEVRMITERNTPYLPSMLAVRGNDVISVGISEKQVGSVLDVLLREVQLGTLVNDRASLMKRAESLKTE